jgi:putative PIG3 family NAD(P)H quinone oxidoreductase
MTTNVPEKMKVIEINKPGGPEVLVVAERPVPELKSNEVLIKVQGAGVNGPDIVQRKGLYPPPEGASDLPGVEVAGEVVSAGSDVERWKIGDRVCALTNGGGYAEYCPVDASHCLPVPEGLSVVEAAGLPETFFTVWSNIFMTAALKNGETFLVHGGAGGIGSTAIMLGKAFGAKVFATDSPAERCEKCKEIGADRVVNYMEEDFVDVVRNEGGGASVILDILGGDYIARNIKACRYDGRIVQIAFNLGSKVEIDLMPVMLKRLTFTGSTLRSRDSESKAVIAADIEKNVWPKIVSGEIKPPVNKTFSIEDAADAHRYMEAARHFGKIILTN